MPLYALWTSLCLSFSEIIEMVPDILCQFLDLIGQIRVPFLEHIANTAKVVLVLDQGLVTFQLLFRKPFDYAIAEGRAPAILRKAQARPFRPFLEQLLLVDGTPEFDIGPFHFFFTLRPSGAKQDCFCGNKNTS
jgi:hypothetical protein